MNRKVLIAGFIVVAVLALLAILYLALIAPDQWDSGVDSAATGVDDEGNPWIGARNPELVIHEYIDYDCPHCPKVHQAVRSLLVSRLDTIRLVRHDFARMSCEPTDTTKPTSRCELVRASICASKSVPFWKWNDRVISDPRSAGPLKDYSSYVERMRESFGIPKDSFNKCLNDPKTIDRAQAIYKDTRKLRISYTPAYVVDGRKVPVPELLNLIKKY